MIHQSPEELIEYNARLKAQRDDRAAAVCLRAGIFEIARLDEIPICRQSAAAAEQLCALIPPGPEICSGRRRRAPNCQKGSSNIRETRCQRIPPAFSQSGNDDLISCNPRQTPAFCHLPLDRSVALDYTYFGSSIHRWCLDSGGPA